jgi:pimeloyl-ACP methyl ester carboxylesterase
MGILPPPDVAAPAGPPQNIKEYDPEWARAFWTGTAAASCDHARMLSAAKAPILVTHHYREIDPGTGTLMGAVSEQQVKRAGELITDAGQRFEVVDLPDMVHAMHAQDPELFAKTVLDWSAKLDSVA